MALQTQCTDKLKELAVDPVYGNRSEDLESLAAAVADEDDDSWTGIDLVGAFPPHTTVSIPHKVIAERALGVLAGLSVFLPVAWTWWSLQKASAAYEGILADDAEAGRTFLAMWTTGFDGQLDFIHQLVPMATIAVALIVMAMGLIVTHRLVSQRNVAHEERGTAAAESRLAAVLTMAQRCLNERRADDSERIAAMVKRSVRALRDAHEDVQQSAETLTKTTEQMSGALQPLFDSAAKIGEELKTAALAAQDASGDLGASVKTFSQDVTSTVSDLTSGATNAVSTIGADVAKLHDVVNDLLTLNSSANTDLKAAISELGEVIGRIDDALLRHESALQGQASELTGARDAAERLLQRLEHSLAPSNGDSIMNIQA